MMVKRGSLPASKPATPAPTTSTTARPRDPTTSRAAARPLGTVDPTAESRTSLPTALGPDDDENVW